MVREHDVGIVLGSASPRRAELLRQIGVCFEIVAADVDESVEPPVSPDEFVRILAERKAAAVVNIIGRADKTIVSNADKTIVIGADTTVVTDGGEILGKPRDAADAIRMLRLLSGRWHEVYTGVALCAIQSRSNDYVSSAVRSERSRVKMCEIGEDAIRRYAESGEPDGKAGAYAIQGAGSLFIERVEGCYSNIVGLPLHMLNVIFESLGYDLLEFCINK